MKDIFYKKLIEESPIGYSYNEIICDNAGVPCDFKIIDVNSAYENITGFQRSKVIGKQITEVLPNIVNYEFDWIGHYGDIALNGNQKNQEYFSENTNTWYRIYAYSPEKYYFTTNFIDISKEKEQLAKLEDAGKRMENILEGTNVGTWEWNAQTGNVVHNERWAEIFGYTLAELFPITNSTLKNFVHPDDLKGMNLQDRRLINQEIEFYDDEYRMKHKNGNWVWIYDSGKVVSWTEDGKPLLISGTHTDITERKQAELALKDSEEKYRLLFEHNPLGVIHFDNKGIIINCNENFSKIMETSIKGVVGFNILNYDEKGLVEALKVALNGKKAIYEGIYESSEGGNETNYRVIFASILTDKGMVSGGIGIVEDITEKKTKEEILFLSFHDQLTGLYNRRFYEEERKRLDTERNLPLTLIMGDVNGLKLINDTFGHGVGDELLIKAAEIIRKGCRSDDIISRIGGDEFVILLPQTNEIEAEQIINRINNLSSYEKVGAVDISVSFGFETKSKMEYKIEDVYKKAEDNMYNHKIFESPSIHGKTINAIMKTLYEKNKSEEAHSQRVSKLCECMGEALDLSEYKIKELKTVGLLHDIGKIAIGEHILSKPGKLTDEKYKEIKRHSEIGYRILSTVNEMPEMADYVLSHHERWDGAGYPKGLKAYEIPLESRIIAIADAYDAMTGERSYGRTMPEAAAREELRLNAGTQFDAELVNLFIEKVLGDKM